MPQNPQVRQRRDPSITQTLRRKNFGEVQPRSESSERQGAVSGEAKSRVSAHRTSLILAELPRREGCSMMDSGRSRAVLGCGNPQTE